MDGLTGEEAAIVALVSEFTDREVRPVARELEHTDTYPEKLIGLFRRVRCRTRSDRQTGMAEQRDRSG